MRVSSVLIIDDNEADRYILQRLLKKGNISHQVFEATNGREALDFLSAYHKNVEHYGSDFPPVLVFVDINMPMMGGFEFLEAFAELRQQHDYSTLVFVMFTSSQSDQDRDRAARYDFVRGFVTKMPESAAVLEKQLGNVLPLLER